MGCLSELYPHAGGEPRAAVEERSQGPRSASVRLVFLRGKAVQNRRGESSQAQPGFS